MYCDYVHRRWPNINHISGIGNGRETKEERERFDKESELDDKINVRPHITRLLGEQFLPVQYYKGPIESCNFDDIPVPCVIKTRCQTGGTVLLSDKGSDNISNIIDKFKKRWSYRGMNNDVIIEEKLTLPVENGLERRYELMTFGGVVKTINVTYENISSKKIVLPFDRNWCRTLLYHNSVAPIQRTVPKPDNLMDVIDFAEKCAKYYVNYTGIHHVRVSVYDLNGNLKFGEYTGATCGGSGGGASFQKQMGYWWKEAESEK